MVVFLKQCTQCPKITTSISDLLFCLQASSPTTTIHGYFLHYHIFLRNQTEKEIWCLQYAIVSTLRNKRNLSILLVQIHPGCDMSLAKNFRLAITRSCWVVIPIDTYFIGFGDYVFDSDTFYLCANKRVTVLTIPILVRHPPSPLVKHLDSFVHAMFKCCDSLSAHHSPIQDFPNQASQPLTPSLMLQLLNILFHNAFKTYISFVIINQSQQVW